MREKGATERPQAFRYERAPDRYARMPCQYVRLPFHVERTSIRIERMSFRRGRIRGSFRFARDSLQINAISVPLCAISWDYSRSNICNARSIFREKAFHFRAHAHHTSTTAMGKRYGVTSKSQALPVAVFATSRHDARRRRKKARGFHPGLLRSTRFYE